MISPSLSRYLAHMDLYSSTCSQRTMVKLRIPENSPPSSKHKSEPEPGDPSPESKPCPLAVHKPNATSIADMPNEIMVMIFKLVSDGAQFNLHNPTSDNTSPWTGDAHAEVVLSHVCHEWRNISLGCSELWANFNHYKSCRLSRLKCRLKTYLRRADKRRTRSLDLWFCLESRDQAPTVFDQIIPYASQWRRLSLTFLERYYPPVEYSGPAVDVAVYWKDMWKPKNDPSSFENLEILDLPFGRFDLASQYFLHVCGLKAPKLKALRTSNEYVHDIRPFRQISVLHLDCTTTPEGAPSWTAFESILTDIPNLTSLSIPRDAFKDPDNFTVNHLPITAPNLQHFRCSDYGIGHWIFRRLTAPCLELLILFGISLDFGEIEAQGNFYGLSVFSSLKTLALIECPFQSESESFMGTGLSSSALEYGLPIRVLAHSAPNITQLIFGHGLHIDGDGDEGEHNIFMFKQLSIRQEIPSTTRIWACLDTLTFLPTPRYGIYWSLKGLKYPLELVQRLHEREMFSKKGCKLQLPEYLVHGWRRSDPELWHMGKLCEPRPSPLPWIRERECIPWPPVLETLFHRDSETKFYTLP